MQKRPHALKTRRTMDNATNINTLSLNTNFAANQLTDGSYLLYALVRIQFVRRQHLYLICVLALTVK